MTSTFVRGLAGVAGAVALVITCTGCQEAKSVIVVNECGREIQANADDVADISIDPEWTPLAPGARKDIRQISDQNSEVFIWVRASATDEPIDFSVPVEVPSGADIVVRLRGDRCPVA